MRPARAAVAGLLCLLAACSKPGPLTEGQTAGTDKCTYVSGPNFSNHKACYQVKEGADGPKPVYQGDIKLARTVFAAEAKKAMVESGRMATSISNAYRDYFWQGDTVPFTIEGSGLSAGVADALNDLETRSGVNFVPRTNESDYLTFVLVESDEYCGLSYLGQIGGKQEIEIASDCITRDTIQHEVLHSLGFWHEQSRPDRDDFVRILWANIAPGFESEFDIVPVEADGVGPYDFGSVMHYGRRAGSRNGQDTIQADTEAHTALLGTGTQASDLDVAALKAIYGAAIKVDLEEETDGSFNAYFSYKTGDAVTTKIRLGLERDNLDEELEDTGTRTEHELGITGFSPKKRYFYSVLLKTEGGEVWSQTRSFITDLTPPQIIDERIHRVSADIVEVRFSTNENTQGGVAFFPDNDDPNVDISWVYDFEFGKIHNIRFRIGQGKHIIVPVAVDEAGNETLGIDLTIDNDTLAPVISNVAVSNITASGATITWTTNEDSTSKVRYGTTETLAQEATSSGMVKNHSVTLSGLTSGSTYFFKVESADAKGNVATSSMSSFSNDSTPPVISGIAIFGVGNTTATITWTTNELSDTKVLYGTSCSNLGTQSFDATKVLTHTRSLTGLTAGTSYCFRVVSKDAAGNESTSSDQGFSTIPLETVNISNIYHVTGTSSVTVHWTTNIASNSVVEYGTSPGSYPYVASSGNLTTSHAVTLSANLSSGVTHYYRVRSTSAAGTVGTSSDRTFFFFSNDTVSISVQNDSYYYWLPRWVTAYSSDSSAVLTMQIIYKYGGGSVYSTTMFKQSYGHTAEIPYYLSLDIYAGWLQIKVTSSRGGSATY